MLMLISRTPSKTQHSTQNNNENENDADAHHAIKTQSEIAPACPGSVAFLVNFPTLWTMCLDMFVAGAVFKLEYEVLPPGIDLSQHEAVVSVVDITMLPKAIGGDAISTDKESGKEDERCCLGVDHLSISAFVKSL